MGHSQGSHRAPRGGRRAAARVPVPPPAPPRSLHEERTIVARWAPDFPQVHHPTVLDTPLPHPAARPAPETRRPTGRPHGTGAPRRACGGSSRAPWSSPSWPSGTVAFLVQDKAVRVSVDGTSRTLHTFADDVGELLDAEGVTVGARDTVAPAPATGLDDGDEIVVRRGTRVSGPAPGRAPGSRGGRRLNG